MVLAVVGALASPARASIYDGLREGQCMKVGGPEDCLLDDSARMATCEELVKAFYGIPLGTCDYMCKIEVMLPDYWGGLPPEDVCVNDYREYKAWTSCGDCATDEGPGLTCWCQCQCGPCDEGDTRWVDGTLEVCVRPGDGGCNEWILADGPAGFCEGYEDDEDDAQGHDQQHDENDHRRVK